MSTLLAHDDSATDATALSFETAIGELQAIVRRLDEGKLDLESAIVAYERGVALRQRCESLLEEARLRVEKLVVNHDGSLHAEPFSEGTA